MLQSFGNPEQLEPVTTAYKLREEIGSSLQLRNLIRQRHAEWSQATFGDVGPIGPLKHLSKEALEAAAEPGDLSEWADMQFLLWDAQRRAGISDGEITAAMEEKLKLNMARQWPEPKDGEPRLHIKTSGNSPVIPDGWVACSERMPEDEQEVIVQNKMGYRYVSYFDEHSGLFFDMRGGNQMNCIEHIFVTHWMPMPAAPQQEA
ncbi:dATP/dGTP pyrophosphohydrolase domain-containing protein [Enterobacter asburiae]|uniref:dATP/dGTP pyrophosphohydrolase domain-containing protein n=1 Tax=Enterobacter asburiae TaxID=61645 RepID=UPI003D7D7B47